MNDNSEGTNEVSEMDYRKRAEMYVPVEPSYSFDRVILPADVKEKVEEALSILQYERKVFGDWGFVPSELSFIFLSPSPASTLPVFGV